jgi:Flp pilus assembly pilin Flp
MGHPMEWFVIACAAVWFTRKAVMSCPAKWARLLSIFGLCLNASVTNANGGTMPVVGMPERFVVASTLWQRAGANTRLLFLADQHCLYYFSIGDLLLIVGGIVLVFCWLHKKLGGIEMNFLTRLWTEETAQDIAEYAVMLAVILVIVVGTIKLIGSNANRVFSETNSSLQ